MTLLNQIRLQIQTVKAASPARRGVGTIELAHQRSAGLF